MVNNKENPLTVVYHYPDGTVSDTLDPKYGKLLAKKVGEAASRLMSDESYIRLVKAIEEDEKSKGQIMSSCEKTDSKF